MMNAEAVIKIIQALLAPVLMISACGLLVLTIQNRYGRLNDRLRSLTREKMKLLEENSPSSQIRIAAIDPQIPELLKRNKILRNSLVSIFSAVTLFILAILFIALCILYNVAIAAQLSLFAFMFGLISIFLSMSFVLAELLISHNAVASETRKLISAKKIATFFLFAGLMGCSGLKPVPYDERPLAAVLPFNYAAQPQEYKESVTGLADSLAGALVRTGRIRLVERQRVDSLLKEIQLGMTGSLDSATAAQLGKQLGAEAVIIGSVISVSVLDESRSMVIAEMANRTLEVVVEARMVAVETGELIASGRAVGRAKSSQKQAFGGKLGTLADSQGLLQKALSGIGEKLSSDLVKSLPTRSQLKSK